MVEKKAGGGRVSPRLTIVALIIVFAIIIIVIASNAEENSDIDWSHAVSQGAAMTASFVWVLISLMVVKDRRAFYPAAIGFSLLFLGFFADFTDEFVQPPAIFLFIEKFGLFAGMFTASIGIYSWARAIQTTRSDVEKMVEQRTLVLGRANAAMSATFNKKDQALQDVNRRTRNNLQLIESLLRMQMRSTGNEHERDILKNLHNRINSIGLIHSLLNQSDEMRVPAQEYFKMLVSNIISTFEIDTNRVQCMCEIADVSLSSDNCTLCGIIANELVTNSLKHAFPDERKGQITVSLSGSVRRYVLAISDNGMGLPVKIDIPKSRTLGFRLVNAWVRQMKGSVSVEREEGTAIRISFRDEKAQ